jgi:hypothetical protein
MELQIGDIVQTVWDEVGIITENCGFDEEEEDVKYSFHNFNEGIEYFVFSNHIRKVS